MILTSRFTKISAAGSELPRDATEWEAVIDNRTGLMWSLETRHSDSWKDAQKVPATIKAAGFTDWRMPTVEELFLLADRTRCDPAIDTEFFPGCPLDWFHTSTVDCESPLLCSWFVYFFEDGSAGRGEQSYSGFVRAVRLAK